MPRAEGPHASHLRSGPSAVPRPRRSLAERKPRPFVLPASCATIRYLQQAFPCLHLQIPTRQTRSADYLNAHRTFRRASRVDTHRRATTVEPQSTASEAHASLDECPNDALLRLLVAQHVATRVAGDATPEPHHTALCGRKEPKRAVSSVRRCHIGGRLGCTVRQACVVTPPGRPVVYRRFCCGRDDCANQRHHVRRMPSGSWRATRTTLPTL